MTEIRPQAGPQESFLASNADIAVYGGAAGGGKTFAVLLEPLRHASNTKFRSVTFRRTTKQVTNQGGLWDESNAIYPHIGMGAVQNQTALKWDFKSGAVLQFAHLEHEKNKHDWQGAQITLIIFDELTHFTRSQFFYMLSRNRSMSGIKPYVRATTNPDADSWVAELISWWIDQATGYAIHERSGVLRWFVRDGDKIVWADKKEDLDNPKSLTFISASVFDNKILLDSNPDYLQNLKALSRVDRERLLDGNWKVRPSAGLFFRRSYFPIADAAPSELMTLRYWDRAATEKREDNDPDFTVGVKMGKSPDGKFYILDVCRFRGTPHAVQKAIVNTAYQDGRDCTIVLEQDPGQAGKSEVIHLIQALVGYNARAEIATQAKVARASPLSAQCEAGNVILVRGAWNEDFLAEGESFPDGKHDDQVDAASGAFNHLCKMRKINIF